MNDDFDEVTKTCRAEIDRLVPLEKIVSDLHSYLELDKDESVTVSVLDENKNVKQVVIERTDDVTVFAKKIVFHDPRLGYFPLTVRIGIGKVSVDRRGDFMVAKCLASLHYNHSFEMTTADFDYDPMYVGTV